MGNNDLDRLSDVYAVLGDCLWRAVVIIHASVSFMCPVWAFLWEKQAGSALCPLVSFLILNVQGA